jgi:Trk-type K+ transport system membrane component
MVFVSLSDVAWHVLQVGVIGFMVVVVLGAIATVYPQELGESAVRALSRGVVSLAGVMVFGVAVLAVVLWLLMSIASSPSP